MKKSTYILIGFLTFFFISLLALHIDSKNYEDEYLIIRKKAKAISELRTKYHVARKTYLEYKSQDNWDYMIKKAKLYFSGKVTNSLDYNSVAWDIVMYYKKHNDIASLKLANKWAKKGIEANPENGRINDTYAAILFELGDVEEAIKQQRIAVDYVKTENHEWSNLFSERLERYENYLDIDKVEIGSNYIDATLIKIDSIPVKLSELLKNKTTLLAFWNPTIGTSRQVNRTLIPLHHKFKDKGLQIIGISETNRALKLLRMKQRIAEESLQWLNLIDTDPKGKVWDAYGVINSNNANFLIDKNGKVISIDSNIDKLISEIEMLLKK
jgi:peroxiredoxin